MPLVTKNEIAAAPMLHATIIIIVSISINGFICEKMQKGNRKPGSPKKIGMMNESMLPELLCCLAT
jgi:hypothetical protein